jgi:uncharacterized protein YwgA
MANISSRNLLLLMLGVGKSSDCVGQGINGITRLQKLLFLLTAEGHVQATEGGYDFQAYKAGPYSPAIYDDLEFLENLGFIRSEISGAATTEEAADIDITFEELMEDEEANTPDVYDEKRFSLTPEGQEKVKLLLESKEFVPVAEGIRKIKSRYGSYSLDDLLYYIYTKYPEWTTESEIKDHVLRKGRKT